MTNFNLTELISNLSPNENYIKIDLEYLSSIYACREELSYLPNHFSYETYEYLIINGLSADTLLNNALKISRDSDKQYKLIQLALENKANPDSILSFPAIPSNNILKALLDRGLSPNKTLTLLAKTNIAVDQAEKLINDNVFKLLIEQYNANIKSIDTLTSSFPIEIYQYLTTKGLDLKLLLEAAFVINIYSDPEQAEQKALEKRGELIDLALKHNVNLKNIYSIPVSLSINELRKLIDHGGLDSTEALSFLLRRSIFGDVQNLEIIPKEIESQINLIKYLVEEGGAILKKITYISTNLPYETYEYLIEKGLNPNLLFSIIDYSNNNEIFDQLIQLALTNKANVNHIFSLGAALPSIENLNKLLDYGLDPDKALNMIINFSTGGYDFSHKFTKDPTLADLKLQLVKLLLEKNADIHSIEYLSYYQIDLDFFESLLNLGLDPNVVISAILLENSNQFINEKKDNELTDAQKNIIEIAITKNGDINFAILKILELPKPTPPIISLKAFEYFIQKDFLKPSIALEYAINCNSEELTNFIFTYSVDVNSKTTKDKTFLELALLEGNINIIDLLLENGANPDISLLSYVEAVYMEGFKSYVQIIKKFPTIYNQEKVHELLKSYGLSESQINGFIDLHNLSTDYINAKNGQNTSLSLTEIQILDQDFKDENLDIYNNLEVSNRSGFTALHLAIISNKFELVEAMIKEGFDIYARNYSNITPLQLIVQINIPYHLKIKLDSIIQSISEIINDVDIDLGNGESLVDILIANPELSSKVLENTNDSLFYLFKENADLFAPSKDLTKTYIAISHGEGFWSSGAWSLARLMVDNHPNTTFHLVEDNMIEKGGDEFLKQFDAFINPGAGDSYPSHLKEFTKSDCPLSMPLENHYQNILDKSYQLNTPYFGMCAGAQHFSLYHGGSLKPIKNYNTGQHQVTFIKGSFAYFLSLTKEQQQSALSNCEMPDIVVQGDTAHYYAAVRDKLGGDLELGAISEHGVAMAYAHKNGIRYATQFHPEHHYQAFGINNIHEKTLLDNFIHLAKMHHDFRVNDAAHPSDYFQQIQERLEICVNNPTCLKNEFEVASTGDICLNYSD